MVRVDRITGETASIRPQPAPGEPAYRWHWDTPLIHSPARLEGDLRGGQQGVPVAGPRHLVDGRQPRPNDGRQPRRHRHDGREEQRDAHLPQRRHRRVAGHRVAGGVAEAPGPDLHGHGRRRAVGDEGRGQDVDERVRKDSRRAGRHLRVGGRAVTIRREHGLCDVRRPPAERLRDVHLCEQRRRPVVAVDRGEPEGRGGADADGGPQESRRAVSRHRDGPVRDDRSRQELDAHQGQPADRADRRDHAAPARQRDAAGHARAIDLDPRSSGADPGIRGRTGGRRREAVLAAAGLDVPAPGTRSQLRVLGRSDVLRTEPAPGRGDHLVPEAAG